MNPRHIQPILLAVFGVRKIKALSAQIPKQTVANSHISQSKLTVIYATSLGESEPHRAQGVVLSS